ncbi:hypothetical protein [Pseudoclavibacter helvolus]|uniref:hypothetical protein n=1 Tax=Pseudoclavibacter helvolus TaxID=255205 RepID=UPI003C767E9A
MKLSDARLAGLESLVERRAKADGTLMLHVSEVAALLTEVRDSRALLEPIPEPCGDERYSWDVFRPEQMDAYYLTCDEVGDHDKHRDHETGGTWPV